MVKLACVVGCCSFTLPAGNGNFTHCHRLRGSDQAAFGFAPACSGIGKQAWPMVASDCVCVAVFL